MGSHSKKVQEERDVGLTRVGACVGWGCGARAAT